MTNAAIAALVLVASGCNATRECDAPTHSRDAGLSGDSLRRARSELIFALGDPELTREDRRWAAQILAQDTDDRLIPLLIEASEDSRLHDPIHQIPNGGEDQPRVPITAGEKVGILLYFKLCRNLRSNYHVDNWKKWWASHSSMSIDQIRDEIDAWDKEHFPPLPR